jgi:hypothetical protein
VRDPDLCRDLIRCMSRAARSTKPAVALLKPLPFTILPPFFITNATCLSRLLFVCWRNLHARLFPVETWVSDLSHLETFDATEVISRRYPAPKLIRTRQGYRTGSLRVRRKPAPNLPSIPPADDNGALIDICSIEWCNCAVNK